MTIEEEVARALAEWRSGEHAEPWEVDMYMDAAAALSPLLNRVRAEALREAAEDLNKRFQDIPAWTEAYREGVRTDDWMQGGVRMTMSAIDVLRDRADRIEQNSEGNET